MGGLVGIVSYNSFLNMKALVSAFNHEKALVGRGLLLDYKPSCGPSFEVVHLAPPRRLGLRAKLCRDGEGDRGGRWGTWHLAPGLATRRHRGTGDLGCVVSCADQTQLELTTDEQQ